jgi:hypothetical protein
MAPTVAQHALAPCGVRCGAARARCTAAARPGPAAAARSPPLAAAQPLPPLSRALSGPRVTRRAAAAAPQRTRAAAVATASAGSDDIAAMMAVAVKAADAGAEVVRAALDLPRNVQYKGALDLVTECVHAHAAPAACTLARYAS